MTNGRPDDAAFEALATRLRPLRVVPYDPRHADDVVRMWRASFERALGLSDPHPIAEQRAYLESQVLPGNRVLVVLEDEGDGGAARVVAFVAASDARIAQLYVAVDRQRRGIGEALLGWAKARSPGVLRLHTFERNAAARAFYERHGFRVVGRGFEAEWRLPDLEYEWVRDASGAT